jgi:hypothetical protein
VQRQTQSSRFQRLLRGYAMDLESCRRRHRPEPIRFHQIFLHNSMVSMGRPLSSTHLLPATILRSTTDNSKNHKMRCNTRSLTSFHNCQ